MGHILRSKVLRNSIFKYITTFEVSHIDYVINYMWQSRIRGFYKFGLLLRKVGFLTLQLNKVSWPMIKSWLFHLSISLSFFWFSNSSFLKLFQQCLELHRVVLKTNEYFEQGQDSVTYLCISSPWIAPQNIL